MRLAARNRWEGDALAVLERARLRPTWTVTVERLVCLDAQDANGLEVAAGVAAGLTPHSRRCCLDVAGGQTEARAE